MITLTPEVSELHAWANKYAESGDLVAAMILDDIAYLLSRGKTWPQLLDDVIIREPYVN